MPGNFTGRVAERKELTEWFTNSSKPMFVYEAIGGMGKSAVTWFWLHEDVLNAKLAVDGVIWWSFYEMESRFETFLDKALIYVTQDERMVKNPSPIYDRMDLLFRMLCKKHYLIILDGAERILQGYAGLGSPYQKDEIPENKEDDYRACVDPNAGTFLQWLTSPNFLTKTLVTSRLFPKELDEYTGCHHRKLDKMQKEDAVEFFQQQGIKGTRAEIETACKAYGYHPLSLRLLRGMILRDLKHPYDIVTWTMHNPLPKELPKEHNIFELAYDSLGKKKRNLISKLAAFRNPMDYQSMVIFQRGFGNQQEFDDALIDLVDRGLLLRDLTTNKFDLHPIIRRYCYDQLTDKQRVHSLLRDYFSTVPSKKEKEIETLADLDPVIELYHHTVNSGRYDEAQELFRDRISERTYYSFGEFRLRIDLLHLLFPDGEDKLPRLKDEARQGWTLEALANSYSLSGQPLKAIPLMKSACGLAERLDLRKNLAIALDNLGISLLMIGEIDSAESNFRKSIRICQEIHDEFEESIGYLELGCLLAYRGKFQDSEQEIAKSTRYESKTDAKQGLCLDHCYRALRALLMSDPRRALEHAQKAGEMAREMYIERDTIWAEWLIGAASLASGNLKEAENHLNEALQREKRINLVELEASILLEFAKLRHAQKRDKESLKVANGALTIAAGCEYRLQQAEIYNFLAQFYFDTGDKAQARKHAEIAKERAECGYVPALNQAKALLAKL